MMKIIAENRKARFDYHIEDVFEAGLVLTGTEVKSLRSGKVTLVDCHADEINGELFLLNVFIPEYEKARIYNHYPTRPRKLLLHRKELKKILGAIKIKGKTAVPLKLYFNKKNLVKVELAIASGKKLHDKRQSIKERDWNRNKARILKSQD